MWDFVFNDYMKSLVEPGRVTAKMSAGIETEAGTHRLVKETAF